MYYTYKDQMFLEDQKLWSRIDDRKHVGKKNIFLSCVHYEYLAKMRCLLV